MAFDNENFRQAWSAETTIAFLRRLTIGNRLNAAWDGDAMTSAQVFIQNPNYNVQATAPARKANWGKPNEPSAERITLSMDQRGRVENMLYVEDEVENAVRDYRARLQTASMNALATQYENNVVTYILGLASAAAPDYSSNANGGAGEIREIAFNVGGDETTGFSISTGKPTGNAAAMTMAREWVLEFFTDARVTFEREEIHLDGGNITIGGMMGMPWVAMPIELYAYGLAPALEAKGIDLPFMANLLRNLGVFGTALAGHYRGFDIFVTNALARPAAAADTWNLIAASDQAVAGPRRMVRNYVRDPANADGERYEFRHAHTYGRALANSRLIIKGSFDATA